jgi:hypothetical protein
MGIAFEFHTACWVWIEGELVDSSRNPEPVRGWKSE